MPSTEPEATVLLCANGEPPPTGLVARLRRQHGLCVATDGALDWLIAQGQAPDHVLGDLDSATPGALAALPPGALVPTPDQEACDLEKSLHWCLRQGARSVTIVGATGRRFDHTLTTVSLLLALHRRANLALLSGDSVTRVCSGRLTVSGTPGDRLSLAAMAPAHGVSLDGVRWPLRSETLEPGSRGVSNEMAADVANLTVVAGALLVTHFPAREFGA